jgi:hypothetical protein
LLPRYSLTSYCTLPTATVRSIPYCSVLQRHSGSVASLHQPPLLLMMLTLRARVRVQHWQALRLNLKSYCHVLTVVQRPPGLPVRLPAQSILIQVPSPCRHLARLRVNLTLDAGAEPAYSSVGFHTGSGAAHLRAGPGARAGAARGHGGPRRIPSLAWRSTRKSWLCHVTLEWERPECNFSRLKGGFRLGKLAWP